jgi:predicted ArsR family transcriptional regulator
VLRQLLRLAVDGGPGSLQEMAGHLGVSPALAQMMLGDLVRMGLLRSADAACGSGCGGCLRSPGCGQGGLWIVTEAGRRALEA